MQNIFNIIGHRRFLFLHIIRHISVIKCKKGHIAIAAIWFELTTSFKYMGILNSRGEIEIYLAKSLTFSIDSVSDFNCLNIAVALLFETFRFLLMPL